MAIAQDPASDTSADRPRIAVCGEVSSGKSAVIQALLRESGLPDFFGVEERADYPL